MTIDKTTLTYKRFKASLPHGEQVDTLADGINANETAGTALAARVTVLEGSYLGEVANAAAMVALDAVASVIQDGAWCTLADTGVSYRYNIGGTGSEDPPYSYDGTNGVWYESQGMTKYVHDPVADVAAMQALAGDDLINGMLCRVENRGDGKSGIYYYLSATLPTNAYGTVGGVAVQVAGSTGHWTLQTLAEYIAMQNVALVQRFGSLGAAMIGAASTWKLSDEGDDAAGHGIELDYDGAHAEEINLTNAEKDAATTIALTLDALNAKIAALTEASNAALRFAYDTIAGDYVLTGPAHIDYAALVVGAPAAANDIGVALKLAVATGTGTLLTSLQRSEIEVMRARTLTADEFAGVQAGAPTGADPVAKISDLPADELTTDELASINGNAGLDAANFVMGTDDVDAAPRSRGTIATIGMFNTVDFAAGETLTLTPTPGVALVLQASVAPAAPTDFLIGASIDATIDNIVAKINDDTINTAINVRADNLGGDTMLITKADAPGGTPVVGAGDDVALTSTCATVLFDQANLTDEGYPASRYFTSGQKGITTDAATIMASTDIIIGHVPWAPTGDEKLTWKAYDSTGAEKAITDTFELKSAAPGYGSLVVATQAGATHLANTDYVVWSVVG